MNCQSCGREFDEGRRRPKLLPKCGHSLCLECLDRLRTAGEEFRCPADNISYARKTEIFDNAFIIESLVAARASATHCTRHGKDLELFCEDCSVEICTNCALFGEHKTHRYEELLVYRGRVSERLKHLRKRAEELELELSRRAPEAVIAVSRAKSERHAQIDGRFEELTAAVERARATACEQSSAVYETLLANFEQLRLRLREFAARVQDASKEGTSPREELLGKELRELEKAAERCEPLRGREALLAKTEVVYYRTAIDAVGRFAVLRRTQVCPSTPKSVSKLQLDAINEEDNLLQESFKELVHNTQNSLLSSGEKPARGDKTPPHPSRVAMAYSPVSNFHGNLTLRGGPGTFDTRKLSLSPLNTSMTARSPRTMPNTRVASPAKSSQNRSAITEPPDLATSLKTMQSRSAALERVSSQIDLVLAGKSNVLDLSSANLDDRIVETVARRLAELKSCKTIKLNNNQLTEQGLKSLLKSIKDLNVEYLFLSGNSLRDAALDYLISFRKYNAHMKCVYLNSNSITKNTSKTKLKLKLLEEGNMGLVL